MTSSSIINHRLPTPPDAERRPHQVTTPFGVSREDPYYWLRDDSRKDPQVLDYIKSENDYTDLVLSPLKELKETLYNEIIGRIRQDDSSVPYRKKGWWYYSRYIKGLDYPVLARRADAEGISALSIQSANEAGDFSTEQVLLDENAMAEGKDFFSVGAVSISPDDRWLAWCEDLNGRRQNTVHVKSLHSGEVLSDRIDGVAATIVWTNDSQSFFYIENDPETLLSVRVKRHVLGTSNEQDELVYEEADHSYYLYLSNTRDERYVLLFAHSTDTTEIRYTSADQPAELIALTPREEGLRYEADHFDERWVISTNADGADNFRLMSAPSNATSHRQWQALLPYDPDVQIEEFELFSDFIALCERSNGLLRIRLLFSDGSQRYVQADEPAYSMGLSVNSEPQSRWLRYGYTSLAIPSTIYELNLDTDERHQLKQQHVNGYDPDQYITERVWVKARDGISVPVSLVYHKDVRKDGSAPLYQYAYGSYGASMDPYFSAARVSLLDRGVVYALAHIRGGEEMGRQWYDAGRLLNKQNTFNDFIDITHALIEQGYGDKNRVAAAGGSAGGLLMGAVVNQAAADYRVIEAHVPFVDIVTTMLDPSIPLTTNEYDEWGNPEKPDFYDYMLSYSPYDNVSAQAYPAMYISTGLWDSQVQYWEPVKWLAKLRDENTGHYPLVLRTNMEAGHGGKSGRFKQFEEVAESSAFVLDQLGAISKIF